MATRKSPEETGTVTYKREDLARSEMFRGREDLVMAILAPDREYTVHEAEEVISQFKKRKVK